MGKARRGPALFELLGDEGGRAVNVARVPRWWSSGKPAVDRHASRTDPSVGTLRLADAGSRDDTPAAGGRVVEVDGDRIRVSLTSVTAAAAIFLILAVLTAAYVMGSRGGDRAGFRRGYEAGRSAQNAAAADEIQAVRGQPPATHLIAPLLGDSPGVVSNAKPTKSDGPAATGGAQPSPGTPAAPMPGKGWVRDLTYIVVQEFPAGAVEKARHAHQFLAQKGVDAAVVTVGSGVHLITTQGYDHKDAGQKKLAEQLLGKIRTIGGQYYAAGGGYKLEGYYKTLKRDSW